MAGAGGDPGDRGARQQAPRLQPAAPGFAALAATAPLAAASALPRGRPRPVLVWARFMGSYKIAFEIPYDRPERLRRRVRIDEPIAVDERIGAGEPPGQRLQERLRRPPQLTALDRAATMPYLRTSKANRVRAATTTPKRTRGRRCPPTIWRRAR